MKTFLGLLLSLPVFVFGQVGPDLSAGSNTEYFTQLRMDYAANPGTEYFPAWNLAPENEELTEAYREGELERVLEIADSWLRKCPVDADTHLRVAMCFKEKGDFVGYNYHMAVFYGLLQSITSSGDGLTAETAFTVISVREEYSLIYEIGARVIQQSLVDGPCDKMELSRREEEVTFTLYFNVAIPLKALEDELKANQEE